MKIKKLGLSLAVTSAFFSQWTFSSNAIDEEIITIGTRTPEPLLHTLTTSTVITSADIERLQAKDIFELLASVPGASLLRNGGKGSQTSLILRGNQSDHTLFLVDGVRIGSATLGSANLAALNTSLIDRVEIINGPKSALYGSDAIGGVVNIITRKSDDPRYLSIETGYGSNETQETTVVAGLNGANNSLTVVANSLDTQGIDSTESKDRLAGDDDAFRSNSIGVNYHHRLTDDLDLRVSYNRNEGQNEYDTNCTNSLDFSPVDCLIYADTIVESLAAKVEYQPSETYSASLQVGQSKDESENLADNVSLVNTFNSGEFNTTKKEATWLNHISLTDNHLLTAGLDYQLDEVDGSTDYAEDSRYNKAALVQLQSGFGAFDTIIGGRYDDNEQFGSYTTASFLAGVDLTDNLRLVASYGEGFKAPTFNDLYFPSFGDPTFEPEESKNYELGLKGRFANGSFYVAAYKNELTNLIQYNPAIFAADQTAEAEIKGLEFNIDADFSGWLLGFSASAIDPVNKVNGQLLRRRAERTASFSVDKNIGAFGFGASLKAESERYDDVANTARLSGYGILDIRAQYQINPRWKIKAKINNVLDKEYATALDFSLGEYQAIGREAFISVVYTPSL